MLDAMTTSETSPPAAPSIAEQPLGGHPPGQPLVAHGSAGPEPESFQITVEAAELYEAAFVPGFFAQWAPVICDLAGVKAGDRVLDVACGTGIVARTAAERTGPAGQVIGLDRNEAMLDVARRVGPGVDWRQGDAASLPFPDRGFDVVLCQMALMFFPDRPVVLREMARVVTGGGTVGLLVPSRIEAQPMFEPFVDLAARLAGPTARSLLTSYFVCGDLDEVTALVEGAGLRVSTAQRVDGWYRAPSVDAAVTTEVESTPLVERMSEATYRQLRRDAGDLLARFTDAEGRLEAPFECLAIAATPTG
jgi:ubiquinone/menaquinone biosynthesis C-methylase UbiE